MAKAARAGFFFAISSLQNFTSHIRLISASAFLPMINGTTCLFKRSKSFEKNLPRLA
jgi:hypothetical protein